MHFLKSIRSTCELICKNEITHEELYRNCLDRANALNHLNAFISLSHSHCDNSTSNKGKFSNKKHLLNGIPFAIKDNFSSKELNTTCASKMLEHYKPTYNATVLQKLLDCGAALIGKTNMDEWAMGSGSVESCFGPVKNPWTPGIMNEQYSKDDWRLAGGSSGGSAAAVASGMCMFAIGSDTGGSVRNPASYCGVVGLKPTYGLLSRLGLIPLVNSMESPSILTKFVDDAWIVMNALKGRDKNDSTSVDNDISGIFDDINIEDLSVNGKPICIGIPNECLVSGMSSDVIDAWRWAADEFENAGAKVVQVSLPHMRYSIVCYHILNTAEVASNMARFDGLKYGYRSDVNDSTNAMYAVTRQEGFGNTVRNRILVGNYFLLKKNQEKYFEKAQKVRRLILRDYQKIFGNFGPYADASFNNGNRQCDVLLYPSVLSDAPLYSNFIKEDNRTRSAEQDVLTQSANLAGIPAITVPTCLSKNRLPISLQITGPHFSENNIVKVASFLEKISNFPTLEQVLSNENNESTCRSFHRIE